MSSSSLQKFPPQREEKNYLNGSQHHEQPSEKTTLAQHQDIADSNLRQLERHAWCALVTKRNRENFAWPKLDTIAKLMGVSDRTAQRCLNRLMAENWICLPRGDSGGREKGAFLVPRGNGNVYHLHPDGKPCGLLKAALKQHQNGPVKGDRLGQIPDAKGCQARSERVTVEVIKGDCGGQTYKEGTFLKNILKEHSERRTRAREENGGGERPSLEGKTENQNGPQRVRVVPPAVGDNYSETDLRAFERLEDNMPLEDGFEVPLLGESLEPRKPVPLDPDARRKIRGSVVATGKTLEHFACWMDKTPGNWKSVQGANNPPGFLIYLARNFGERAENFPWPNCLICGDIGAVEDPTSPFHAGKAPCACAAGDKLRSTTFEHYDEWKDCAATGKRFCLSCLNTGRVVPDPRESPDGTDPRKIWRPPWKSKDFCGCETGKAAHREWMATW